MRSVDPRSLVLFTDVATSVQPGDSLAYTWAPNGLITLSRDNTALRFSGKDSKYVLHGPPAQNRDIAKSIILLLLVTSGWIATEDKAPLGHPAKETKLQWTMTKFTGPPVEEVRFGMYGTPTSHTALPPETFGLINCPEFVGLIACLGQHGVEYELGSASTPLVVRFPS